MVATDSMPITLSLVFAMGWFACVILLLGMNFRNIGFDFGTQPQGSCP